MSTEISSEQWEESAIDPAHSELLSVSPPVSHSLSLAVWQSDSLPRFDLTFLLHWLSAVGGSSAELELNLNCFENVL